MLGITRRSSGISVLLLLLYPLTIAGYPLVSTFPVLLGVSSRFFSVPFRASMLLLSLFVVLRLITGVTRPYRGLFWVPFVLFWGIYSLRLVSDTIIAPIPLAFQPYEYLLFAYGMCLVPTLAFMAEPSAILARDAAKVTLVLASIAAVAAVGTIWFGISSGTTEAVEGVRAQSETLNPISLGHLGASIVLLAVYFALDARRLLIMAFLTLVGVAGLVAVALSASRGPVLSLACAMLVIFGARFFRRPSIGQVVALVGGITIALIIFYWVEDSLGFEIVSRLTALGNVEYDTTGSLRIELTRGAWQQFLDSPFLGSALEERNSHFYPHNVVIEAFMAGGICLGVVFTLMLIWAAASAVRLVYTDNGAGWIGALFVQYAVAAMSSGALFSSQAMWSLMAGVVATQATRAMRQTTTAPNRPLSRHRTEQP